MTLVGWRRTDDSTGHSLARLVAHDAGWTAHGAEVLAAGPEPLACVYTVELDRGWRTTAVRATAFGPDGERTLLLTADEQQRWTRDGEPAPRLEGCLDTDVAAAPFTNTFPIRRLADLPVGEAAVLAVAWVDVPSLTVTRVEQTYRRLGERRWTYSDEEHGSFTLEVDDEGLVVDYEGLASRV